MNRFEISIQSLSCEPQLNGYWLWQLELEEALVAGNLIGQALSLRSDCLDINEQVEAWLFAVNGRTLQVLSKDANHAESRIPPDSNWQLGIDKQALALDLDRQKPVLVVAEHLAMANAFVIAKQCQQSKVGCQVMLGSEDGFPFMLKPARFIMEMMPAQAIGACTLLEDWQIPNRLASQSGLAGCFDGTVLECLREYLHNCDNYGDLTDLQILVFSAAGGNDFTVLCQQFPKVGCHIFS